MILFLVPVANQRRLYKVAIAAGVIVCVMAQSGHQTIFFVFTLVACGLSRGCRTSRVCAGGRRGRCLESIGDRGVP